MKLIREDNQFDRNAVMVLTESGRKIGYIPEIDNLIFGRLMDVGPDDPTEELSATGLRL